MWRLTEHSWAIAITTAIISALWICGPVAWVVRQNPELTTSDFYAFVKASMQYKHILCLSFLPVITLICIGFFYHFWPRIRARENPVLKEMVEQNRALQAELNSQKDILNNAALAHENLLTDLHRREMDFQAATERSWAELDSHEAAARAKADELEVREQEIALRERTGEIKEDDLNIRDQNLFSLENQLNDQKKIIQAQGIEARTILQDAQVTILRAEAEAADLIERAEQEARLIISREKEQCKAVWTWCHYKAASANVTPDEWKEIKKIKQELRERQRSTSSSTEMDNQRYELTKGVALSDRQTMALSYSKEHGNLTIQDFERICPGVNRRTLQRDLRAMVDNGLLVSKGASNQLLYQLATSCDMATANLRQR